MKNEGKHIYKLELTERQAKLLSYACDQFSRLICGQDWSYQELMEAAWEKRCKEAVGGHGMDKEWDGGWSNMRSDAEAICKQIKKRFWGLERNAMYGVHYDDVADILYDIHCVIRHQLWLDRPEDKKSRITVDASEAMQFGEEPLALIERLDKYCWKKPSEAPSLEFCYSTYPTEIWFSIPCIVRTEDDKMCIAVYVVAKETVPDNNAECRVSRGWVKFPSNAKSYDFVKKIKTGKTIDIVEWKIQ